MYASEAVGFVHNEGIFLEIKYEYSTFQDICFFGYWKIKLESTKYMHLIQNHMYLRGRYSLGLYILEFIGLYV